MQFTELHSVLKKQLPHDVILAGSIHRLTFPKRFMMILKKM